MPTRPEYPIRTRFAKDIVAEVLFPSKQTGRVAILAIGAPSASSKKEVLQFLAERGYVAIFPRYRGTWESDGLFLKNSPAKDIRDVILDLQKKRSVVDVASGEKQGVRVSQIHLFGASFGGPAVLLNTDLSVVKKVIAVAPVINWKLEGEDEPFDFFVQYARLGYGGSYRTEHVNDWNKLIETNFYNPVAHTMSVQGQKVFIIHAKDDTNVPHDAVIPFAQKTGATYYLKPTGGHSINMTQKFLWKKIEDFLKKR